MQFKLRTLFVVLFGASVIQIVRPLTTTCVEHRGQHYRHYDAFTLISPKPAAPCSPLSDYGLAKEINEATEVANRMLSNMKHVLEDATGENKEKIGACFGPHVFEVPQSLAKIKAIVNEIKPTNLRILNIFTNAHGGPYILVTAPADNAGGKPKGVAKTTPNGWVVDCVGLPNMHTFAERSVNERAAMLIYLASRFSSHTMPYVVPDQQGWHVPPPDQEISNSKKIALKYQGYPQNEQNAAEVNNISSWVRIKDHASNMDQFAESYRVLAILCAPPAIHRRDVILSERDFLDEALEDETVWGRFVYNYI